PLHIEGGPPGNAPAVRRSRSASVASSSARLRSFPVSHAQLPAQVDPPPDQESLSLSLSIQCARSKTHYARCDTSMLENSYPDGTRRSFLTPLYTFPEPSLRPLRDCASASTRNCRADRRAA